MYHGTNPHGTSTALDFLREAIPELLLAALLGTFAVVGLAKLFDHLVAAWKATGR